MPVESILPAVQGTLQLSVGNSVKIPYVVLPQRRRINRSKWSTEDDGAVLTVSEDGTITAAGTGTATVTIASVSRPEVKASFEVEVLDAEASLISKTELGCVPSANVDASHVNYTPAKLIDGQINGFQTGWCAMDATKPGGRQDPLRVSHMGDAPNGKGNPYI